MDTHEAILYPVAKDGQWGYIDRSGNQVVPFWFSYAAKFSEGLGRVTMPRADEDPDSGFIDARGKLVIGPNPPNFTEPEFDCPWGRDFRLSYENFSEGYASCWLGDSEGRGGYIDMRGRIAIPIEYTHLHPFSEGLAVVSLPRKNGDKMKGVLTGVVDKTGEFAIPPTRRYFGRRFREGLCVYGVEDNKGELKYGFIDRNGKEVVDAQFSAATEFTDGLAWVGRYDADAGRILVGCIDKTGSVKVPFAYEWGGNFVDGRAIAYNEARPVLIDTCGNVVTKLDPRITYGDCFREGLMLVCMEADGLSRYGYSDVAGRIVIPPVFSRAEPFYGGLAFVVRDDETGYMDRGGHFVWKSVR